MRDNARSDIELIGKYAADLERPEGPERLRQLRNVGGFQRGNVAAVAGGIIERLQPIAAARYINRVKHNSIELNAPQGAPEGPLRAAGYSLNSLRSFSIIS